MAGSGSPVCRVRGRLIIDPSPLLPSFPLFHPPFPSLNLHFPSYLIFTPLEISTNPTFSPSLSSPPLPSHHLCLSHLFPFSFTHPVLSSPLDSFPSSSVPCAVFTLMSFPLLLSPHVFPSNLVYSSLSRHFFIHILLFFLSFIILFPIFLSKATLLPHSSPHFSLLHSPTIDTQAPPPSFFSPSSPPTHDLATSTTDSQTDIMPNGSPHNGVKIVKKKGVTFVLWERPSCWRVERQG